MRRLWTFEEALDSRGGLGLLGRLGTPQEALSPGILEDLRRLGTFEEALDSWGGLGLLRRLGTLEEA